ncbi:MAG: tRNA pseudouridine(38-40) synthase TruA [Bacteroidales bacterium]|nr:tRNA pseudouridine(38-40) synthase TruA [Bacteroidales bacterium]
MYRYAIELSYRGDEFCGWQRQKNARSVQEELEEKLEIFIHQKTTITGCGRTDTGVHARYYVAHVDLHHPIENICDFIYHWNAVLHKHIVVHNMHPVAPRWNARYYAISREYRYFICRSKDPFLYQFSWYFPAELDLEKMNRAAALLIGRHDFTGFAKKGGGQKTGICHVQKAFFSERENWLIFQIAADRFLRGMVRIIVGTLIEVGKGNISFDDIQIALDTRTRLSQVTMVPSHALFLWNIIYPDFPPSKQSNIETSLNNQIFTMFFD